MTISSNYKFAHDYGYEKDAHRRRDAGPRLRGGAVPELRGVADGVAAPS